MSLLSPEYMPSQPTKDAIRAFVESPSEDGLDAIIDTLPDMEPHTIKAVINATAALSAIDATKD